MLFKSTHKSRSSWGQCLHRGGGSWPGSPGCLCPAQRSESGSCCHGARWFPTHTRCRLGRSWGSPERTESRWLGPAHWDRSHHLQGSAHTDQVQLQSDTQLVKWGTEKVFLRTNSMYYFYSYNNQDATWNADEKSLRPVSSASHRSS